MPKAYICILLFALLVPLSAYADDAPTCLNDYLVITQEIDYDFQQKEEHKIFLPTQNSHGAFLTAAAYHFQAGPDANIYFNFAKPLLGLPYNIYRVEFELENESSPDFFRFQKDFTANCTEAGASIYPGQEIHLPEIKIPPLSNGAPRGLEKLHIRIWGHL